MHTTDINRQLRRSVVVLEESPCPQGSSRTSCQVLVLVLETQVLVLLLVLGPLVLVLVLVLGPQVTWKIFKELYSINF